MRQPTGGAATRLGVVAPRIEYQRLTRGRELPDDVLFAVEFGGLDAPDPTPASWRGVRVRLEPLAGAGLAELWYANGTVRSDVAGPIRFAADDHHLAAVLEIPEHEHGGLQAATTHAYAQLARFQSQSDYPHVLRTWNYLDAINAGDGDGERYRVFCTGRAAGLEALRVERAPAATVIGHHARSGVLQVYWLAGRAPGIAIENPRQTAPQYYPRQYGPTAPSFSRAMLVAPDLLMISGTASIVGHASQHPGSVQRQMDEIFGNLELLLARAHAHAPVLSAHPGRGTLIKAYLRHREDLAVVERELARRLPAGTPLLVLAADVCRADLLLEFDCLHAAPPAC
jgi:chorismate lyase/3-hydroxybenzoate synthase